MVAKCLVVVLAVVAEISAFKYNSDCVTYVKSEPCTTTYKYTYQAPQMSEKVQRVVSAPKSNQNQNVEYVRPPINTAPITRNLVAKGKYPIALRSSGPAPDKKIPVITSHLRAPVQEKPTVRLQAKIPGPKTISHTCTCYKTIVKPRVQQHIITVPTIQRYIETFHRPVVENIHYEAYPVKCSESNDEEEKDKSQTFQVQPVEVTPVSGIQVQSEKNCGVQTIEIPTARTFELPKEQSGKSQLIEIPRIQFVEQKPQTVEIPRVQFADEQKPQTIEIPRIQFVQAKKPQTVQIELPRMQFVEHQKPETYEIAPVQCLEDKKPQFVELLSAQVMENNKAENVQLPRVEFLQAQKVQTVEIPRIQVEESPKVQTVEIPQQGGITLGGTAFAFQTKS